MPFGGLGDVRLDGPPLQLAALWACLQLAALALGRPHPDVQKECCTHGQPAGLSTEGPSVPKRFLLREWVVRPMQENLGETPAEAIRPGSKFLRVMANITPETAVTLWCYPDSFEAFRSVREELHRRGLPTAGRPLPEGAPIGGSADGSKSVVQ